MVVIVKERLFMTAMTSGGHQWGKGMTEVQILRDMLETLERRLRHLLQSKFISSFDEKDRKGNYKRDIKEADKKRPLDLRARVIITAYTGYSMLADDELGELYKYTEEVLGRPVMTHELVSEKVQDMLHKASKEEFIELCEVKNGKERIIRKSL